MFFAWCIRALRRHPRYYASLMDSSTDRPDLVRKALIFIGVCSTLLTLAVIVLVMLIYQRDVWWAWIVVLALCGSALIGLYWYQFVVVLRDYQEMQKRAGSGRNQE